ncbi:2-phosphosulfolactate phosphatase [Fuchsiella alkaliacetigena]|uniref:2-phosphosulfolactate phosphatase n=1 Tax=Fuchsiella alkaliacetigena TaxID=957042 RepID=UPI00200AF976|nr:2-phosphosulfolactate phosphatase [Fuchsiella alkaliacetigena]MCK8823862.1 2-phosphosulfolactate phosphatase [Fuchsiella alkaliacetigena]
MKIELILTADSIKTERVKGKATVAIDTFRATSTILTALAQGAKEVIPALSVEEALSYKNTLSDVIIAGERKGEKVEGLDLGNSPVEYQEQQIQDKSLVLTTTNGTKLLLNLSSARRILIAAFLNLSSIAKAVKGEKELIICCAGSRGEFSLEDFLTAGALIYKLKGLKSDLKLSDLSLVAYQNYLTNQGQLAKVLKESEHGRRLLALNKEADIDYALQQDALFLVPSYSEGVISCKRKSLENSF